MKRGHILMVVVGISLALIPSARPSDAQGTPVAPRPGAIRTKKRPEASLRSRSVAQTAFKCPPRYV